MKPTEHRTTIEQRDDTIAVACICGWTETLLIGEEIAAEATAHIHLQEASR